MKIICTDNFDRENRSDRLVATGLNEYMGARIVRFLNDAEDLNSDNFYKLVPDDYKLYEWEP